MNTSRRKFIKNSALAATAITLLPRCTYQAEVKETLTGVQLYSIREDMENDPLSSLKQLAEFGYTHVEHANYVDRKFYGWDPTEFKKILDDLGMSMPSGHTVLGKNHWDEASKDFTDTWKYTVEDAAILGQDFVISPWLDESIWRDYNSLMAFMEVYNKCGELCKQSGMRFGYHNHDFEFNQMVQDELLFDLIMDNIDPELVILQLDFGNLYNGGAKAMEVINEYPGRFPSVHVKDMTESAEEGHKYESTLLGTGIVNVKEVIDVLKEKGGTTQFIIEQESYQGKTPMECVEEDLQIMKNWGY